MATFYQRHLLNAPDIQKEISGGIEFPHDITLEYSNTDGFFTNLWNEGEEFRGKTIKIMRYEPNELEASDKLTYEISGIVTDFNILPDVAEFTISVQDPDPLQTDLPKKLYEIGDWTQNPPTVVNPTPDLGKPYALIFGHAKKVPIRYVHADYTNDFYDYIVGMVGSHPTESNNSNKATTVVVYRNKVVVAPSEYTVYDGSQSSPYPGYAFIRFTKEQRDPSGNLYELHADFRGMKLAGDTTATRNFAKIIRYLLSDSVWGLGLPINSASFATAISQVSNLFCDGFIAEQTTAQDILNELLDMCRATLTTNENGERVINIDVYNPVVAATFGWNDGYFNNIISIGKNKKRSTREAIKSITLNYRINEWENTFIQNNKRDVFPFGEEISIDARFVRSHETADRITCYKQRLQLHGDHQLEIEVGMEGRFLKRYDTIRIIIPSLKIDGIFQIRDLTRSINKFSLNLISYSSLIYDYTAGTLPPDENPDNETDYSFTPPAAPTNFTKVSQGTHQGSDGTTYAFMELSAGAPTINFARMYFGYRKQDEALPYTWISGELSTGQTWKGRIDALVPGISYQLAAVAENNFGRRSTLVTLNSQVAPGDTTPPAQVVGLTGRGKYKTWEFEWAPNTERDLRGYRVQIGTSTFGVIYFDKIVDQNKVSYTDDTRGYGTLYCRVKAVDFTGNESAAWSATASATTARTMTGDINDSAVTNAKIANLSADKIDAGVLRVLDGNVCSSSYGGDKFGIRDGQAHFYTTAGVEIGTIGYGSDGSDYWVAKFLGSDASLSGGVYAKGVRRGVTGYATSTTGFGFGVTGMSDSEDRHNGAGVRGLGMAYGGSFYGLIAPILLQPSSSPAAPTHTAALGALWVTSNGILYINTDGYTTWQKVGAQ